MEIKVFRRTDVSGKFTEKTESQHKSIIKYIKIIIRGQRIEI